MPQLTPAMIVSVPKETYPGERRVVLVPVQVAPLKKVGFDVCVQAGAGVEAGFTDDDYRDGGAAIVSGVDEVWGGNVIVQVRSLGANLDAGRPDLSRMRPGQLVIGSCDPLGSPQSIAEIAATGASLMALEMIPRITRAQSMDVLSSMATIAGYRAVLLGATHLPKLFPMLMTAAGTLTPARVFVIGAGVAGLQAIATSRRLGAVVQAYDVRPAVREQVESLGAKFVELELESEQSEDKGGYAKAMGEEFYQKQRELMASVVAESDVVVTTALIPGRKSPLLITAAAVEGMSPGSVIVDLAAERGGNCELTVADDTIVASGVTIMGPTNLPSEVPQHASQMFGKNVTTLLLHLAEDGQVQFDMEDQITAGTMVAHQGEVIHSRIREMLELPPLAEPQAEGEEASSVEGN